MMPVDGAYHKLVEDGGTRQNPDEAVEIDIFEQLGRDPMSNYFTVHYGRRSSSEHRAAGGRSAAAREDTRCAQPRRRPGGATMQQALPECLVVMLIAVAYAAGPAGADRQSEYIDAVVRGGGLMEWQQAGPSESEGEFRRQIEARKTRMFADRVRVDHPVLLTETQLAQARRNVEAASWADDWLAAHARIADYVVSQPDGYIESMIPELTPWYCYGMTCPNCVGEKSQEAMGAGRVMSWTFREPEVLRCRFCGQEYPSADFPETATLQCPRMGQELTFLLNDAELQHPEDRSGKLAWHWVGHATHVSFTGQIRERKVQFMFDAVRSLALVYGIDRDPRYAEKAVAILVRLAHCYRRWLYHDYWDAVADCDPLYAAWHDQSLPLEWKRHLCTAAYDGDTLEQARMLQGYWGGGRVHPSVDVATELMGLAEAYDLVYDARGANGDPLWTAEDRAQVERDLFMEWLMGAEPFLGGPGEATNLNNKAGRIYRPMAQVAKCLGLTEWVDVALKGFEGYETRSLTYDGFSHESPAYTYSSASYFGAMVELAEALHGFRWPAGYPRRDGEIDLYRKSARFRLLMRSQLDCLGPDGRFPPLSDTPVGYRPSARYLEVGLRRLPEHYAGALGTAYSGGSPGEYAVLNMDADTVEGAHSEDTGLDLPELFFPSWMTGFLRHGGDHNAALLTLHASPPGGHRHVDSLSVYYAAGGRTILGDHGYLGDTPMNAWFRDTASHNLVAVDDQQQRMAGRVPAFEMMATTPRVSVIEASSDVYDQCSEYRRRIALIKGPASETFAVDVFRVTGGKQHAFRVFSELAASDAEGAALEFVGVDLPPEEPIPDFGASTERDHIFGLRDVRRAKGPPPTWQAIWKQNDGAYRLWMMTQVDEVAAANGPGQMTWEQAGRRVRYVDAVLRGEDLASTFVAIHEPSAPDGSMPIRRVERLTLPNAAGDSAVGLRIESGWGTYWVLADFAEEAEVDGIHFQGKFGVFCRRSARSHWVVGVGAGTLREGDVGFRDMPATWRSDVPENTDSTLHASSPRPDGWPTTADSCTSYVRVHDGDHQTGFPVQATTQDTVTVRRFPLPRVTAFELPAVRYIAGTEEDRAK